MDEALAIARLKEGDISALEMLVRRHQAQALRAAYLVTGDRALAEDVVQAAFIRAYERIWQFDAQRRFAPWFLRSVVNASVKAAIRAKRVVSIDDPAWTEAMAALSQTDDLTGSPDAWLDRSERRRVVHEALTKLSPNQRATIVLRYYLGLSEPEIAARLGSPRGTIKRRLHDARVRLKVLLGAAP